MCLLTNPSCLDSGGQCAQIRRRREIGEIVFLLPGGTLLANEPGFVAWEMLLTATAFRIDQDSRCAEMSESGTNRRLEVGRSMSALPGYFRHQLVPLLRGHHRPRCRDNGPCSRSCLGRSGGFAPVGLPLFHGTRLGAGAVFTCSCIAILLGSVTKGEEHARLRVFWKPQRTSSAAQQQTLCGD
jgi:hypothetical protein